MNIISVIKTPQYWGMAKDIATIFGYKSPTKILKGFRDFCQTRPNYFGNVKPFVSVDGSDTVYNIYAFAHYFENRALLEAGSRSIKFKDDLPRLIEAYGLHLLESEVI